MQLHFRAGGILYVYRSGSHWATGKKLSEILRMLKEGLQEPHTLLLHPSLYPFKSMVIQLHDWSPETGFAASSSIFCLLALRLA